MQETTIIDTQPHDDTKSTVENLEKSNEIKLNHQLSTTSGLKSLLKGDGRPSTPHDSIETEQQPEKSISDEEKEKADNGEKKVTNEKDGNSSYLNGSVDIASTANVMTNATTDVQETVDVTDAANDTAEMGEELDNHEKDMNVEIDDKPVVVDDVTETSAEIVETKVDTSNENVNMVVEKVDNDASDMNVDSTTEELPSQDDNTVAVGKVDTVNGIAIDEAVEQDTDAKDLNVKSATKSSPEKISFEENKPLEADNDEVKPPSDSQSGTFATANKENPSQEDETKKKTSAESQNGATVTATSTPQVPLAQPPPPIMRGTLSIDLNGQRHLIRGMWNYENSDALPPQRFELVRNLESTDDKEKLPIDGVFNGSFSLAYIHVTSKGKQKERSKVIPESGVDIKFVPIPGREREYNVEGKGTNQFGVFHIIGTAVPSSIPDDPTLNIVLRKRYLPGEPVPAANRVDVDPSSVDKQNKTKPVLLDTTTTPSSGGPDIDNNPAGPLPEPTKSFPSGVVALRGTLYKEESMELGLPEVVHRINGMWAAGLDIILADPQNVQGLCNRFEYEHKSSNSTQTFPVSGRYSGWFELNNEDMTRTRINERDITLKFRLNNAGYHNIEGKGSNVFGKYTITGTLTLDNIITIFRIFQPRKIKTKVTTETGVAPAAATAVVSSADPVPRPSLLQHAEPKLSLDDVIASNSDATKSDAPHDPITPPLNGTYSAVSQGVLRLNEDGSHSCQGKWAVTREHFTNSLTHPFNFRLETHHAQAALNAAPTNNGEKQQFPLDSAMYKGSFQMKKQGSRNVTIVDQQIVMKFRLNKQGSFNVYGKGINAIGEFNLLGTLVMSGKTGGQVELYRMYTVVPKSDTAVTDDVSGVNDQEFASASMYTSSGAASLPSTYIPPPGSMLRRESSRMSKLPSRLEEDDPEAQLVRIFEKCAVVLRFMRERDNESGAYFSEPVDPVQLGIPTYHQVIKEPMDLKTVQKKMDQNDISSPEEFMRLVRLVFENAMTFNIDPTHSVHQAARTLLVKFNEKIKDVERLVQTFRRMHGGLDEKGKTKKEKKDEKKRKRQSEEPKSLKRQRLDEVEAMLSSTSQAFAALASAAPANANANVTRSEFNLLVGLMQQLHNQIVQTHTAIADLSPGDNDEKASSNVVGLNEATTSSHSKTGTSTSAKTSRCASPAILKGEEKKVTKRKIEEKKPAEPVAVEDDLPLTHEEQEWLTESIGELSQEHLVGVIQLIREAAPMDLDDGEIDIEIDQLDLRTQRKLMKHVLKVRLSRFSEFKCFGRDVFPNVLTFFLHYVISTQRSQSRNQKNQNNNKQLLRLKRETKNRPRLQKSRKLSQSQSLLPRQNLCSRSVVRIAVIPTRDHPTMKEKSNHLRLKRKTYLLISSLALA